MAVELYQGQWAREILGQPQPPVRHRRYFAEALKQMDPDRRPECYGEGELNGVGCPACGGTGEARR